MAYVLSCRGKHCFMIYEVDNPKANEDQLQFENVTLANNEDLIQLNINFTSLICGFFSEPL